LLMSLNDTSLIIGLKKAKHTDAIVADFRVEFCRIKTEIFKEIVKKDLAESKRISYPFIN